MIDKIKRQFDYLEERLSKLKTFDYSGWNRLYCHLIFWIVWFFVILIYNSNNFERAYRLEFGFFLAVRDWLISVIFFYFVLNYILKSVNTKKYLQVLIIAFLFYAFLFTATHLSLQFLSESNSSIRILTYYFLYVRDFKHMFSGRAFWLISFWYAPFLIVPAVIKILVDIYVTQIQAIELEKNNMRLELDYLRTQINPKFLFDTLNNIYSSVIVTSPKAADIVLKLSDLMRYALYEANAETVLLSLEIKFISDYVDLERSRQNETTQILFHSKGDAKDLRIAPLLLLTFVENAFKHGVNSTIDASWIRIGVTINESTLVFKVENSKPKHSKNDSVQGGIGLWNVHKRLDMLYPNRYQLDVHNNTHDYEIILTINLKTDN